MKKTQSKGKIMDDNVGCALSDVMCVTPVARASYAYFLEPRPAGDDEDEKDRKYGVSLIFDKSADLNPLRKALIKAAQQSKWGNAIPANIIKHLKKGYCDPDQRGYPIHLGDDKEDEAYAGKVYFNCNCKKPPKFGEKINGKFVLSTDPEKARSGNYVRCSVTAFAYNYKGTKGVSFALNNVMFIRYGDPLGADTDPENDFANMGDSEATDQMTTADFGMEDDDDIPFDKPGQAETLDESLFD